MENFFDQDKVALEVTEEVIEAITSSEVVEIIPEEDLTKADESGIDWETL